MLACYKSLPYLCWHAQAVLTEQVSCLSCSYGVQFHEQNTRHCRTWGLPFQHIVHGMASCHT